MAESTLSDYQIGDELGRGAFGRVVKAFHRKTLKEVAIKIENRQMSKHLSLLLEQEMLQVLQGPGVPGYIDFFTEGECSYLVMELLGLSVYQRFVKSGKKFTEKTVLMIADQALARIELIHSKHYIHRDIKPENFITGLNSNGNLIYLIDFGLAKKYYNESCSLHIPYKEEKAFAGTLEFASRNAHLGVQMSRRDDLESLMYTIIYLYTGTLPWLSRLNLSKEEKTSKIRLTKLLCTLSDLTQNLPPELKELTKYVLKLEFEETPDYSMMRGLIRHAAHAREIRFDWRFDWMEEGAGKSRRKSEIPMDFVKSVDCVRSAHKKRHSIRNPKAGNSLKPRHLRRHTQYMKNLMLSVESGCSAHRSISYKPQQPSDCDLELRESGEHVTVKDVGGPEFKERMKGIVSARRQGGRVHSCRVA